jgi:hypothetical protein
MKLKAELAIDPSYATGARCLDGLIQDRRMASDSGTADTCAKPSPRPFGSIAIGGLSRLTCPRQHWAGALPGPVPVVPRRVSW